MRIFAHERDAVAAMRLGFSRLSEGDVISAGGRERNVGLGSGPQNMAWPPVEALVEAVAHLNYLLRRGEVLRSMGQDGAWIWGIRN